MIQRKKSLHSHHRVMTAKGCDLLAIADVVVDCSPGKVGGSKS